MGNCQSLIIGFDDYPSIMFYINSLIKNSGAITVAQFMDEALFNPLHGYYRTKKPIGKKGDFTTAPEISQTFGELIAAYFFNHALSSQKNIAFVEMGAGNGTLFYDIVKTFDFLWKKNPQNFFKSEAINNKITFNIIEISESLTKIQQEKLKNFSEFKILWHRDFQSFLSKNQNQEIYFVANELLDCFPIHQFVKTVHGWQERMVTLGEENLIFTLENFSAAKNSLITKMAQSLENQGISMNTIPENAIFEISFAAQDFLKQLLQALKIQGGMALLIDYGYTKSPLKSSLQAVKNHQYSNVLQNVGESDITALVDFFTLEKIAKQQNFNTSLITQREFLLSLGIEERRKALLASASAKSHHEINSAIDRLIDEKQMGELFKCLLIWP